MEPWQQPFAAPSAFWYSSRRVTALSVTVPAAPTIFLRVPGRVERHLGVKPEDRRRSQRPVTIARLPERTVLGTPSRPQIADSS
jgi:hypothetical protein